MPRKQFIEDLEPGDAVKSAFAVAKKAMRQFRNRPGQFLALTLADRSGSVQANVWDNAEEVAGGFREGDIVEVKGNVEEYQGKKQFVLSRVTPCDPTTVDLADFLPASTADPKKLEQRVLAAVASVSHPQVRALLEAFFSDPAFMQRFLESPAAKALHHARIGGLAEHICSALDIAATVCKSHAELDEDLVTAGVLLHDIGKLWELECGATIDYSTRGRLLGHICLGFAEVDNRCRQMPDMPEETRLRLLHIILAHHGVPEYGSPVRPMTPEAIAVHAIENCDAQIQQFVEKTAEAEEQGSAFTEYDRVLERYLYAGGGLGTATAAGLMSAMNDAPPDASRGGAEDLGSLFDGA